MECFAVAVGYGKFGVWLEADGSFLLSLGLGRYGMGGELGWIL